MKKLISAVLMLALFCALLPGGQAMAADADAAWVKDTETVQDLQTGETMVWHHVCSADEKGRPVDDFAFVSLETMHEQFRFERWRYDENGNLTGHFTLEPDDGTGSLMTYDESGRLVREIRATALPDSLWTELWDQIFSTGQDVEPEVLAARQERVRLFMDLAEQQVFTLEVFDLEVLDLSFYYYPEYIFEYEYEGDSDRYPHVYKLDKSPAYDLNVDYSYEDEADGYWKTCYVTLASDGRHVGTTRFFYDMAGHELAWEAIDPSDEVLNTRSMEYDGAGKLLAKTESDLRTGVTLTVKYSYDENGNCIREEHFDSSWSATEPCRIIEYTYVPVTP